MTKGNDFLVPEVAGCAQRRLVTLHLLMVLEHLAMRAVRAGLTDGLEPRMAKKAVAAVLECDAIEATIGDARAVLWQRMIDRVLTPLEDRKDGSSHD